MFCSWRKSPSAPCGCAFQLRGPAGELLNRLCGLGEGTLVLRQQGLSLAKRTPVGLCVAYGESGWNLLRDCLSGLEIDTGRLQEFYLLTDSPDRKPLLGVSEPGKALHLSFRFDGLKWESPAVRSLIREFDGVALDCARSRLLGSGAWLDEWERPVGRDGVAERVEAAKLRLRGCHSLEVEVRSCGHRNVARFAPSFVDVAGSVLRIADRSLRHVVHADVADPAFSFSRVSGFHWRMFRPEEEP